MQLNHIEVQIEVATDKMTNKVKMWSWLRAHGWQQTTFPILEDVFKFAKTYQNAEELRKEMATLPEQIAKL